LVVARALQIAASPPPLPFPTLSLGGMTAVDLAAMNRVADTDGNAYITFIAGTALDGAD
jgi:hypothetical protein